MEGSVVSEMIIARRGGAKNRGFSGGGGGVQERWRREGEGVAGATHGFWWVWPVKLKPRVF